MFKNNKKIATALLVFLHVAILSGLYVWREPTNVFYEKGHAFLDAEFDGNVLDYIKLYYSQVHDEGYYYEWSTVVLGKSFESDYAFEERKRSQVAPFFFEDPEPRVPYRDINFEYPPLMIIPMLGAGLLSHDYVSYARVFAYLVTIAYLLALWLIYRLWQETSPDRRLAWNRVLLFSALSVFSLGQLYVTRLDVFPSCLYLLAIYAFYKRRYSWSAVWIAIGAMVKAYSLLLAPLFAIVLISRKEWRQLGVAVFLVIAIVLGMNFGLAWLTDGAYWNAILFHTSRGIQIESLYAMIPYWANMLFGAWMETYNSHQSINIRMHGIEYLVQASSVIPLVLFALIYALLGRDLSRRKLPQDALFLVRPALLLVFAFMLTFKVFSPQFIIWLTPLLFICAPRRQIAYYTIFVLLLLLTQVIVPTNYWLLMQAYKGGVILITIRNLGLVWLFIWLFQDWRRSQRA